MNIQEHFNRLVTQGVETFKRAVPIHDMIQMTDDDVARWAVDFAEQNAVPTHRITGQFIRQRRSVLASEGVQIIIPLENPDPAQLSDFLALQPNPARGLGGTEPRLDPVPNGLAFTATSPQNATQLEEIHKANIDQRNAEIQGGNQQLAGRLQPAIQQYVNQIKEREAEAARQWAEFELTPAPTESEMQPEPEPAGGDREPPLSPEVQRRLQDAVDLVSSTTSKDVRLRAIQQVREILSEWSDFDDERRMFGVVIGAGLEELEAFVRDSPPNRTPETILANIRRNVEQGIDWANENRYVRFGAMLAGILPFLAGFRG